MTTPSTTSSRPSVTRSSIHESSSPIVISSSSPEPGDFKPHQMLMQTLIEIACGPDLSIKLTVHEELLRYHSRLLEERFAKAKSLRRQYEKLNDLRNQIAEHVFPEVTADLFEHENREEVVLPLIMSAYEEFPLRSYVTAIRKLIDKAMQEEVKSKRVNARMLHDAIRETDPKVRITFIGSRGVHAITEKLFSALYHIDKRETAKAKDDPVIAAAQKRIFMPGAEKDTIQSVMEWIYQGELDLKCKDPQPLYNALQLATQLGVEALSEFCLTKLCNAADDSMRSAAANGTSLKSLLGYGPGPSDNTVEVIFKHAVKDLDAPKRLQEMVVNILAGSLDVSLWSEIKVVVNHAIALQLIEAMLDYRQQITTRRHDHADIKEEIEEVRILSPMHAADD